jgi:rhodanese-related sulfurtransferase
VTRVRWGGGWWAFEEHEHSAAAFSFRELLARIGAVPRPQEVGRAASPRDAERGGYRFGGWQLVPISNAQQGLSQQRDGGSNPPSSSGESAANSTCVQRFKYRAATKSEFDKALGGRLQTPVVMVCKTDRRYARAATELFATGLRDVTVLRGGTDESHRQGLALE